MGWTNASVALAKPYLSTVKSVCELGSQQYYDRPGAPFMRDYFEGYEYMSIDLNGEGDSKQWNLHDPVKTNRQFDLVTDLGTTEHLRDIYMGFWNINKLTKVGGLMFHENPKHKNWPKHGNHYRTKDFYTELEQTAGYKILHLDEHPACWNVVDGWIIRCVMRKTREGFIEREQFPKTYTE
jgi:hypothetical protein